MDEQHVLLLGEISGKLSQVIDSQKDTNGKLERMDGRLRKVETKAAVNGGLYGSFAAVGVSIVITKGKSMIGL